MSTLTLDVRQLNQLIEQKQILEAFDRYYGSGVVMREAGGAPMVGFDANRARESVFVSGLRKWDAKLLSSAVDETTGTALNEWQIDFEHEQFGSGTLQQVAVQRWRDGRIAEESFYKI